MKKIMLIAGCSHASGSEIDGSGDSQYNRQNSYGNVLAGMMGYTPINIASSASANPTIARTVLEWFSSEYDSATMEVFPLISWTESSRIEIPSEHPTSYKDANLYADWYAPNDNSFMRINQGWTGGDPYEKRTIPFYHKFIATNLTYLEILSANIVLQLQYFFKSKQLNYAMCNTMHMFTRNHYTNFFLNQIDLTHYMDMDNSDLAFYWKYKNAGYENPKAQYWHHNEVPHTLYANELYKFING